MPTQYLCYLLAFSVSLPTGVLASELSDGEMNLRQLNLASQQALRRMDQQTTDQKQPASAHERTIQTAIQRRQAMNQRRLQAKQQHELGAQKRRRQIPVSGFAPGLRTQLQQQRFQREQRQQLRRFITERRLSVSVPPR